MIMRLDLVGVVVLGVSIILSALLVVTVSSINPLQLSHITYRSSESEFVSSYDSSNDQQSTPSSSSSSSSSSSEYNQYKNESSSFGDRFLRFVKRMFWFVPSTSFNNDEDDSEYYSGYLSYDDDDNGDDEDEDDIQSTPEAMRSEIQSSRNYYHRRFARRDLERSSLMDSNISSEFLAETQTFFGQATSSSGSGAGVDSYFMTSSGGSGTGASSHTSSVVAAAAAAAASSSYNVSSIVIRLLIGFLLYSITIWTIIGNIIVCVIVLTNRQLKQGGMSNFLIGNLALSDLLLGLTVLPFSATLSTFKTWLFGKILCDLWLSIDVLCSTASIWALLVISLDRYIATNHPIRYRKQKNSIKIAIIYCTVSWLISIMISLGPLFFISSDEETAVRTTTQTSPLSPISQPPSNAHSSPYSISFSNHSGASFVSSSSIINGVKPGNGNGGNGGSGGGGGNGGHVHTSKKSGLRQIENSTDYECVLFQTPSFVILSSLGSFYLPLLMMIGLYTGVFLKIRQQSKMKFKKKTKDRRRKDITSPNKGKGQQHNNSSSPTTKHHHNNNSQQTTANVNETTLQSPPPHKKSSSAASENNNNVNTNTNNNNNNTAMSISSKQGGATTTTTAAATSKGRGSIKSIGSGSVRRSPPTPRPLVPAGGGVVRRVSQLKRPTTTAHHQLSSSEARITKTLGIIMGVFVVCWLPFFLIYNVRSQLADPDSISGNTMEFFLWLGYFNSALNPILYAILNANFRNAFRDILACRCCLPGVSHSSLNRTLSRISSVNYTTTNSSIYYSNTNHKNAPKTTTTTSSGGGGGGETSIDNSTRKMTTTTT